MDPGGLIVKGAGGALVRERLVAHAADVWLVLVDEPKLARLARRVGAPAGRRDPLRRGPASPAELADLAPRRRPGRSDDGLTLLDLRGARPAPTGAPWPPAPTRSRAWWTTGSSIASLDRVLVGRPDGTWSTAG